MSQLTNIKVDFVDNELIVMVFNDGKPGWFSSTLGHFKGGRNQPQTYSWNPSANGVLPPGKYTLLFIGINWGGPSGFKGSVTIGGTTSSLSAGNSNTTGVAYQEKFNFTV